MNEEIIADVIELLCMKRQVNAKYYCSSGTVETAARCVCLINHTIQVWIGQGMPGKEISLKEAVEWLCLGHLPNPGWKNEPKYCD